MNAVLEGPIERFPPCEDDALVALGAFDPCVALIDVMHCVLRWCSPRFEARCGLSAGDSLAELHRRVPASREALARSLDRVAASDRAAVQAEWVRPGCVALKLVDAGAASGDDETRARAERRHLEDRERLLYASRNVSVSEMASTLAHELNQPIGTVTNVLRGIQSRLECRESGSAQALGIGVQLALDQALFASRIIARIRDHTQSRQPRRQALDLAQVLAESLALLDWEIRRDEVSVGLDITAVPCRVMGDATMLQQVLVNLLRNAIEAMRGGPVGQRRLHIHLAVQRDGRDIELAMRDTGCGLPADAEQTLFVPFQSTKPNGMGLGLNICRSFIELHQGRLWFTRHDPRGSATAGSTFHVLLPTAPASTAVPPARPTP